MKGKMLELLKTHVDAVKVNAINLSTITVINVAEIKEWASLILVVISIISTAVIIRNNLKKDK